MTIFPYITPPFGILKKVFPPFAEGGRNFFKIFSKFSHFFKFFHKNSIFLRLPPQKKLKKFSPRKNFPPQFTVSKWFSYPHLWFHQEGFSSPLKNFNNFSPGENLSPPFGPLLVHVCFKKCTVSIFSQNLINNFWKHCPFHQVPCSKSNECSLHYTFTDKISNSWSKLSHFLKRANLGLRNCADYKIRLSIPSNFFCNVST